MSEERPYAKIREILSDLVGGKLIEITQHDAEYFARTRRTFIDLMFDNGEVLRIYGHTDGPILALNPHDDTEAEIFGDKI